MKFYEVVDALMRSKNLRQVDLCRMSGLSSAYMSMFLKGKMQDPTLSTAVSITHALGYTLDEMVEMMENGVEEADE